MPQAAFYHTAVGTVRAAMKEAARYAEDRADDTDAGSYSVLFNEKYDDLIAAALRVHKRALAVTAMMEGAVEKPAMTDVFMVTVRPAPGADLADFLRQAHKWAASKCWTTGEVVYAFEQKGMTPDTLGDGFHVHAVGRSPLPKAQLVQRTASAFKAFCKASAVQVDYARTPADAVQNYLVAHKSDDGHKELTMEWDHRWRQEQGLKHLYGAVDHALFQRDAQ